MGDTKSHAHDPLDASGYYAPGRHEGLAILHYRSDQNGTDRRARLARVRADCVCQPDMDFGSSRRLPDRRRVKR